MMPIISNNDNRQRGPLLCRSVVVMVLLPVHRSARVRILLASAYASMLVVASTRKRETCANIFTAQCPQQREGMDDAGMMIINSH